MRILIIFLIAYSFYTCTPISNHIQEKSKGNKEIEKVLAYYSKTLDDSLKLEAALFLINNMKTHNFPKSKELNNYYNTIDLINTSDSVPSKELVNKLSNVPTLFSNAVSVVSDWDNITADILIDNIDNAFLT